MPQKSILSDALDITSHDRHNEYGPAEANFQKIADYWNTYISHRDNTTPLAPKDVAMMMALMKIAREDYKHKKDTLVDCVGYLRLASVIEGDEA